MPFVFKRPRAWQVYLVLLALSQLWLAVAPREREAEGPYLELPRQGASGAVAGPPVRVAYQARGRGPAVIYLHGSPGEGSDGDALGALIARDHRFITLDLPGFGRSSHWIPDYGIEAHARYVLALMDALGIARAHLVCHSMGSGVAYEIASLAPERVTSIVSYGGIGVQEGEGSGDYALEHAKYAVGYVLLVAAPELVPHFGLLGPRWPRHSFIRNFWDTDQRPLRGILESLQTPLLLLHGRRDPLVPPWTAREHHRIVQNSELVMLEASHFMVFSASGAARLAEEIEPFLARYDRPGAHPSRRTVDYSIAEDEGGLPTPLDLDRDIGPWAQLAALVSATFVSEDLTCISSGLLARAGQIDPFVAVLGCVVGIFVGDLGLWLLGRLLGRRVVRWRLIARRLPPARLARFGQAFDRHLGKVVMGARFLPGTRLPMYVAAGIVGRRDLAFVTWLAVAGLVWTPILVLAAFLLGPLAARPFVALLGVGWLAWVAAALTLLALVRLLALLSSWRGRARLAAAVSRIWRWEFWPTWLFYLPLAPWIALLALRYRGLTTPTAANPALPHGGFVGESKAAILAQLPATWVQPSLAVVPGEVEQRLTSLRAHATEQGWTLPLVLKPDEGQRGRGVKLARDWDEARAYLAAEPRTVLGQPYHPGPLEAGLFYYRLPSEPRGRIFSITDKLFPEVVGDGRSTLEELILRDRRLRMQAAVFTRRHAERLDSILASHERVRLAVAGNHCQGTMFRDGPDLRTPELERALDEIARHAPGFAFGRFDVRYESLDELKRGRGFKVIELNGVTSESTNVYDPSFGLLAAYRTLARQWALAFRIGDAQRREGHAPSRLAELWRAARAHYRGRRTANAIAD